MWGAESVIFKSVPLLRFEDLLAVGLDDPIVTQDCEWPGGIARLHDNEGVGFAAGHFADSRKQGVFGGNGQRRFCNVVG